MSFTWSSQRQEPDSSTSLHGSWEKPFVMHLDLDSRDGSLMEVLTGISSLSLTFGNWKHHSTLKSYWTTGIKPLKAGSRDVLMIDVQPPSGLLPHILCLPFGMAFILDTIVVS